MYMMYMHHWRRGQGWERWLTWMVALRREMMARCYVRFAAFVWGARTTEKSGCPDCPKSGSKLR